MVHLHTHSMYSLRDSIIRPEEIIQRLAEIGQSTIAITDHGNSLGGVSLYKVLKENGIKYIHGVEFYTCDDVKVKDKNNKYYHLVALCKNEQGRLNLNKLMSMSQHPDNFYSKPRIDFEMLSQYGEGLIIMSACLAGEVSKAFIAGEDESAKEIALRYQSRFGEDYYLEVQAHRDPEQIEVNRKILSLAQALNIQVVVTCDAHYTWEKDKQYQNKYAFNGSYKEDGEAYVDCFIQSEDEIRQRLSYLPQEIVETLISNTDVVAAKCNVEMPLSAPIMPEIKTPPEFTSNKQWLQQLCVQGFKEKLNIDLERRAIIDGSSLLLSQEEIDSYIQRYEYELNALDKMGFIDYILLVYSYSNVGHRRGIARGSGGGSLINYLTNITNIDPIEHKLYFERFIDVGALAQLESGEITPKELKIPDIDLDFSGESCDEVMRFLYETYGEERVASIGKFGTNQTKGTIRDMCKVLDISLESADKIAKAFENYELDEIDNMISGQLEISAGAKTAIQCVKDYPVLFDYVRKLNGLPKSFGLHACGKVISTRPLDDFLPSCYDSKGIRYLQGDMHDVEDVGLVKVDVLGLRTLDAEYDALEMAGEDLSFVNPKQDFKDPNVLRIFSEGDTLGIFQMASSGMKSTLKKMNVSGIEDLSVANALFRPGSLQYIDAYCNRKAGRESFEYLHPDLEPILENTFGIIVFQEQLIEIGRMAGLHNPDLLRKATGKKNPKLLAEIKPELESKLKARGWTQEQFNEIWSDMLEFAKYSFNKSHSSAYAIIAYMTAKEKAYYPAEFYAGLCNSYIGESSFVKDNAAEIVEDISRHNIRILPFDFRQDHRRCNVVDGKLVWAIPLIKDCNQQMAEVLYQVRDKTYTHFWRLAKELRESGLGEASIDILIKLGFFNEFGNCRELLRIMESVVYFKYGTRASVKKAALQEGGYMWNIICQFATDTNDKGDELKTFRIIDCESILDCCEDFIKESGLDELETKILIQYQTEKLGFSGMATGKESDRRKLYIRGVYPLNRKSDGKQFGYSVIGRSIGSGKESRYTVFNRSFDKDPIQVGDMVYCEKYEVSRDKKDKSKVYYAMTQYHHII